MTRFAPVPGIDFPNTERLSWACCYYDIKSIYNNIIRTGKVQSLSGPRPGKDSARAGSCRHYHSQRRAGQSRSREELNRVR